jgi:hypothetical protein
LNTTIKESTVVIMDPDQFFISPIDNTNYALSDLRPTTDEWRLKEMVKDMHHPAIATPGVAVAQTYGLGDGTTDTALSTLSTLSTLYSLSPLSSLLSPLSSLLSTLYSLLSPLSSLISTLSSLLSPLSSLYSLYALLSPL